ncbi:hypothetical protein B0A50_00994 [Salinomyces thailandicus]|uniref:F-box domain-containing protein n=1 Tax=Salinomyces thailandicus TaxID=706561 RepID=A0A4V6WJX7_9PEZI|nr:hypothetical protein B0A50_00994 [Salinomyces thailandica]
MDHLLQLPPELLLRISDHLTTTELGHLRQTCKHVESTLFDTFAKEFFTKRQFMLEKVSLQALIDIANHPTLSLWLTEVIIGADALRDEVSGSDPWPTPKYRPGDISRDMLLQTGIASDMLVEAFSKLPNLRTIGLRDYYAASKGSGRERDGPNAVWRSYGWTTHGNPGSSADPFRVNGHLTHQTTTWESPEYIFPVILHALAKAELRPENVDVFLRKRIKLTPNSFNVFDPRTTTLLVPVLAGIRRLMLSLSVPHRFGAVAVGSSTEATLNIPLKRFLSCTPGVQCLRLNFTEHQRFADRFLEWFGLPRQSSTIASTLDECDIPPIELNRLTELDLGMVPIKASTLVKVIAKFRLKSLNLWKMQLMGNDDVALKKHDNYWSRVFTALAGDLAATTQLQSVMVGFPSQLRRDSQQDERIEFVSDGDRDNRQTENLLNMVSYRSTFGSSVTDWLREMAAKAVRQQLPMPVSDFEDEDEMDDSDISIGEPEDYYDYLENDESDDYGVFEEEAE